MDSPGVAVASIALNCRANHCRDPELLASRRPNTLEPRAGVLRHPLRPPQLARDWLDVDDVELGKWGARI
jgi:hypothetical protein